MSHLVATYGYWIVALFVGAESLGVPLPGETALVLAAIFAGHSQKLSVGAIFAVAAAAAIVGDNLGYCIGRTGGYRLLRRYGHYIRVDESKLKVGRYLFDRHGGKVVFLGRFVSVLRTYAAFLAGTNKMYFPRFFVYNAAGGIIWAAIYTFVAYVAGDALRRASGTINVVLGILAAIVLVVVILVIRGRAAKLSERAEEAYPGPLDSYQPRTGKRA